MRIERYYKDASFAPARWYGVTDNGDPVRITYRTHNLTVVRGSVPLPSHPDSTIELDIEHKTDGNMSRLSHDDLRTILAEHDIHLPQEGYQPTPNETIRDIMTRVKDYVNDL